MFEHIDAYAGDPIFKLVELFQADPRKDKVNLTIGLYYDEEGKIPLLASVQEAEKRGAALKKPRAYLPMEGLASYRQAVQHLLFGADSVAIKDERVVTVQTLGGTGALKIGADFLHKAFPAAEARVSDPAWDNYYAVFQGAGVPTSSYRYYDATTQGLNFTAMMEDIAALPAHTIVVLNPCCHNPTGVDPSAEQWAQLIPVLKERNLIPFVDIAYQGFGRGLEEDTSVIRSMVDAGLTFLVASSFSKNFSYYGERCGALSIVCQSKEEANRVQGQLKATIRRVYSNPPTQGAQAIAAVLQDAELFKQWDAEVAVMRDRIATMRKLAHEKLKQKAPNYDSSYFVDQFGMFCYTGLTKEQILRLRDEFGVYMLESGRVCVPGLNSGNIDYFVDAVAAVVAP
ncbi:aromatic amino acid transaminase [Paenalcaligenes sp. Me131]|uniref:amino acid aminotransferase n=1 Tax=Paenalcaligenes sp. Me131 TaxID=3392636 RepID=UPI003D2A3D80